MRYLSLPRFESHVLQCEDTTLLIPLVCSFCTDTGFTVMVAVSSPEYKISFLHIPE